MILYIILYLRVRPYLDGLTSGITSQYYLPDLESDTCFEVGDNDSSALELCVFYPEEFLECTSLYSILHNFGNTFASGNVLDFYGLNTRFLAS